jgi:CHASE3 domain sensor protein
MNWFRNLKTGAKLLLGFGSVIVALGAIIVVAYGAITSIRDSQRRLFEHDVTGAMAMIELRADLNRQRARALEMMLTTNRAEQEALSKDIASRIAVVDGSLQEVTALYRDDPAVQRKLDSLKSVLAQFRQARDAQIKLIVEGKIDEAKRSGTGAQADRFEKIQANSRQLGNAGRRLRRTGREVCSPVCHRWRPGAACGRNDELGPESPDCPAAAGRRRCGRANGLG